MLKAKIMEMTFIKSWTPKDSSGTTYYYYSIRLSNNETHEFALIAENEFVVGDQLTYELNPKPKVIRNVQPQANAKPPRQNFSRGGSKRPEDYLGFVYGYAKDIHIAKIQTSKKPVPIEELKKDVEIMYAHIHELLGI